MTADDTPAPTTRWLVDDEGDLVHDAVTAVSLLDQADTGLPDEAWRDLVALVRRAGATPDLTALDTRKVQRQCHLVHPMFISVTDIERVLDAVAALAPKDPDR
jgi:hypothetical protein